MISASLVELSTGSCNSDADSPPLSGVPAPAPRRQSPGARLLEEHARVCSRCRAVAISGQRLSRLCVAGQLLATAALLARAGRRSS
jgi:hypothetical protein